MPPGPARSISSRQNPPATAEQSGSSVPSAACPPAPYPQKGARMCGIVGYAGRRPGKPIILDGLKRLEYRGYDSAGIVLVEDGGLESVRAVGNLDALFAAAGDVSSEATVGLGHTRWATHGRPSHENAHPHDDCTGQGVHRRQRHRRELQGAARPAHGARARLQERDRRRGRGAPHRGAHRRGPYGGCACGGACPEGPLRLLRRLGRRARRRRGHPQPMPARRRRRRRRDVLRLGDPRLHGAHAYRGLARGRRRRHAPRRRRGALRRRRRAARA